MIDKVKQIRAEVERLKNENTGSPISVCDNIIAFIDSLQEEPVSEELDGYAYQCAYDLSNDWMKDEPTWDDVETACKLGAKWQKIRMTKNAINIKYDNLVAYDIIYKICQVLGKGGKGKMVIIKEEEV